MNKGKNETKNETLLEDGGYLWDGSGEPDPEIRKLEVLLEKFGLDRRPPVFPEIAPGKRWSFFPLRLRFFPVIATTAAVGIIATVAFLAYVAKPVSPTVAGWDVSRLAGTPRIGGDAVGGRETKRLGIGQVLETDQHSRANLRSADVGQIEMEPSTRLRLMTIEKGLKRIALDRGTIHTYIWAPPGQFVVDTPSAVTVDLGCAYTLQVDDSGAGLVRTSMGWVGFKRNGRESFIPAGTACATRPKVGPGTPYREDASSQLRSALERFDFEDSTPQQRAGDLEIVLGESRKQDALTLWHLLARVDQEQRALVYDRFRALAPPPPGVTREGILRLDLPMLDQWWNELGFDDISVWRHWERTWSGTATPFPDK